MPRYRNSNKLKEFVFNNNRKIVEFNRYIENCNKKLKKCLYIFEYFCKNSYRSIFNEILRNHFNQNEKYCKYVIQILFIY